MKKTIILYGWHACLAALENKSRFIHHIWLARESDKEKLPPTLSKKIAISITSSKAISEKCNLQNQEAVHQGIAIKTDMLEYNNISLSKGRIWVILDQVTDPHNIGAILRVCAALDADGVVQTHRNAPSETGTLAKAASGALEHIPIYRVTNLARTIQEFKDEGFWVYGFTEQGQVEIGQANLSGKIALVFGAEGSGMRHNTMNMCDALVKLSTNPNFPTLNVSHAVALALYEAGKHE